MVSLQIVIAISVGLIAWMRYTAATQENGYEFEERLRNYFAVSAGETKKLQNKKYDEVFIEIEQVVFEEYDSPEYILKRTLWPWQEISGWVSFSCVTHGFVIDSPSEFEETMNDNVSIVSCGHEHHSNHYYVEVDGEIDYDGLRMEGYDLIFYYIANSEEAFEQAT